MHHAIHCERILGRIVGSGAIPCQLVQVWFFVESRLCASIVRIGATEIDVADGLTRRESDAQGSAGHSDVEHIQEAVRSRYDVELNHEEYRERARHGDARVLEQIWEAWGWLV